MRLTTVLVAIVALGAGVAIGVKLTKTVAVQKVEGGADKLLQRVGLRRDSKYGNAARSVANYLVEGLVS